MSPQPPHPSPPQPPQSCLVVVVNPLHRPSPRLTVAAARAGALGVLELPDGDARGAVEALDRTAGWSSAPFGVRVRPGCPLAPAALPAAAATVLLADPGRAPAEFPGRRVLVEVTHLDEARAAAAAGAAGLIVRGSECGGRSGGSSTFVLLQRVLAGLGDALPVWAAGGIGPHTAAAAVVGGAAGVVLDTQLALFDEAALPLDVAETLATLDGTETVRRHGVRVLRRRGPGAPELPDDPAEFLARVGADPRTGLLPVGQDAPLAAAFARRWSTVTEAVRGVRRAVADAVRDERPATALGADAPATRVLGTRLPVVQGPMTRVSDQPEFAAEVAAHGGLPFLALALSDAERTRDMLERTSAALGDAPWGVGILGFADEAVRTAQLDVVRRVRPTHAIVAGGRPAQAAALEAEGIATFLHVPSPGLLRQFLAAGARRFVFEGAECGGHVGPRNSFPLWEAQLEVLLDHLAGEPDGARLSVLFAGGVHDARSAAMTAALAAPLTRAGVATGVLMGTAYLFTEEAVAAGAIKPLFQRHVVAAEDTELLETAPGHATRCARSAFGADFERLRAELRAEGVPEREIWERLERFNVGRLRLASKGVERVGAELRAVDERRQAAEGMFMAGEAVALRDRVTTLAELHASVSEGAERWLRARAAQLRDRLGLPAPGRAERDAPEPAPEPLRVAVVGMAGMFPGAQDLSTFWANVLAGRDCVTEVPPDRWDPELYYDPDGDGERTPSRWGGFLPPVPFDPLRYGIPPASLAAIEPVQLLALEAASRALADAGYAGPDTDHRRTSVIFGTEAGSDLSNASALRSVLPGYLGTVPAALDEQLPRLTEDSFPGMLANVIAGRIANRLDLGGANYTVDAACASSLTAVDAACKELLAGTSDLVLCGGADLHNGINDYLLFSSVHALSPSGRSATFDQSADGIALGEGVACVVLKRLADAERDGDRIYAVIDGVGSASDGRALGLTAPRPEGQRAALSRAYANARVSPADVGLIEAHGTGTVVGDRTELTTLTEVFEEAGAAPGSCVIGSVKSQIGHTKCAAGLAGLIKATLALYHGVRPPTLHLTRPNEAWSAASSPFAFHTEALPWAAAPDRRIAGVSAFGFGGTNFHVVLRAYQQPPAAHALDEWPAELLLFRGRDAAAARAAAASLLSLVERGGPWRLRDYARQAARRADLAAARGEPVHLALVVDRLDALPALLRRAASGESAPADGIHTAPPDAGEPGKLAFLFPGQGSQRPGMLAELLVAFPELQRHLRAGARWADRIYPPAAFDEAGERLRQDRITDTAVAQPALGLVESAAAELLAQLGVRPDMAAGHSYGELVALGVAGALAPADVLTASAARAEAILAQVSSGDPGGMAAIAATPAQIAEALRGSAAAEQIVVANHNAPRQTVISGPTAPLTEATAVLRDAGFATKPLRVACAFHSPRIAGAGAVFARQLSRLAVGAPAFDVWANRTATPYPRDPEAVIAGLAEGIGAPVRFTEQIEAMHAAGARVFVEVGPGRVLSRLVDAILEDRPHTTVALDDHRSPGLPGLLTALARLAVAGVDVRAGRLLTGRDAVDPETAATPTPPGWTVDGRVVRRADGTPVPGALQPPRLVTERIMPQDPQQHGAHPSGPDALIAEFLRTSRELVAAQRDVLLGYLGAGAAPASPPAPPGPPPPPPPRPPSPPAPPAPTAPPTPALEAVPAPATAARPPGPAESATPAAPRDVLGAVLAVVAERTGYPAEMIEPDLDLEADLSVDSIKRAEIAGELASRLGLPAGAAADLDQLGTARTAAGLAALLEAGLGGGAREPAPEPAPVAEPTAGATAAPAPRVEAPRRLEFTEHELPEPTGGPPPGATVHLIGGGDFGTALAARLTRAGATAQVAPTGRLPEGAADTVVYLDALDPQDGTESPLPEAFPLLKTLLARAPRRLLAVERATGPATGLRGLFRTIAREYPELHATLLRVGSSETTEALADRVLAELTATDREPVVLADGGRRRALRLTPADLGPLAATGAGPAGDGAAEAAAIGLDRDSVLLLAGGARGITARFARAVAAAGRCRLELLGRTPVPAAAEDPATAGAADRSALRAAYLAAGLTSPAAVERAVSATLAEREVRATLAELRALGSPVRYHSVDILDAEAVRATVKDIHAEHGRIDGVVHAAGVIEDKLIAEKTPESFRRVFTTKVDGARTLLDAVGALPRAPRFAVLFGSVAAALGNRGQSDYAAANDALQELGRQWSAPGRRGLTVHWGPWAPGETGGGMVTPELARSYAARGIGLIDPEEGPLALLRELAWGAPETHAVVYAASGW
ncbi:SDR family oxidoreductase [Streptomyces millisiae]